MIEQTGTPTPATAVPPPPGLDLITPELMAMSDEEMHAAVAQLRDSHQAYVDFYTKWLNVIRARVAAGRSESAAAKAIGVSRATVRKAAAKKDKKPQGSPGPAQA